ncbi:MAG: hypothetical protein WC331_10760 [Candidatus Omnitrophota bacterium]|jgi:hypothetical protein
MADLNDPEVRAAITAAKKEAEEKMAEKIEKAVEEATAAQQAKNKQLLDELKKARRGQEVDPDAHAALQEELADTQAKLAESERGKKAALAEAEKTKKTLEGETGFTRKYLVESELKGILIKGGVKDEDYIDVLTNKFGSVASVIAEGDTRKAMFGDKELATAVNEYLSSPAGKKFVAAPVNSGGGANGGGTGGNAGQFEKIADPQARLGAINQAEAASSKN